MDSDAESNEAISDDDFIVDDEGQPINQRITARREYCDASLQEARELFGVDFDYGDIQPKSSEDEEEEDSYESEDQSEDDEGLGRRRRK